MQTMQTVLRMGSMTETKVAGGGGSGRGSMLVNGGRPSISTGAATVHNLLEDEGVILVSNSSRGGTNARGAANPSSQNKLNKEQAKNELHSQANIVDHPLQPNKHNHHAQSLKSSSEDFRKALNLHPPPIDDDDDDVFDINSLNGRHIAETTFISIPVSVSSATVTGNGGAGKTKKFAENGESVGNGDPAKEKLIQHVVEQHVHQQQQQHQQQPHDKKTSNANSLSNPKDKLSSNAKSGLLPPTKEEHDLEHEITETTPFCK